MHISESPLEISFKERNRKVKTADGGGRGRAGVERGWQGQEEGLLA